MKEEKKKQRTAGQRRRTESYENSTYKVSQKKMGCRKRMHRIWMKEGMKEVREQQLCDQRRQIEEKHCLEELEMETIKQKIEGQSTKDTEVAPVVPIVTEEDHIDLFGTESDDETFYGDWSEIGLESSDEQPEAQSL